MSSIHSKITVFDIVAGANRQIDANDFDRTKHVKLDGSIEVDDQVSSLGEHKTTIWFNNAVMTTADAGASGASGSLEIFDFPEGAIGYQGGVVDLHLTGGGLLTATSAVVAAVGTVAAAADATLTSTEADLIPSTACTLSSSVANMRATGVTPAVLDGTGTAKKAWLNAATVDAGSSGAGTITVYGSVTLNWRNLGDHA